MSNNQLEKLEKLVQWAVSNGSKIDSRVYFKHTESSGISAFYTPIKLQSDHLQITVSDKCIVTPLVAQEYFQAQGYVVDPKINQSQLLKLFIGYTHRYLTQDQNDNRDDNSLEFWRDYFTLLPQSIHDFNIPLTWPLEELEFFKGTNMYFGVPLKLIQIYKEYLEITKSLGIPLTNQQLIDPDHPDAFVSIHESCIMQDNDPFFQSYLYGHMISTSRAFPYRFINNEAPLDSIMLLPVVDLLNHQPLQEVYWEGSNTGFTISVPVEETVSVTSLEMFNNYGPKGNEELLMGYGFVISENKFDSLTLSLSLSHLKESRALPLVLPQAEADLWGIKLPQMSDYTFNVSELKQVNENDGTCNENLSDILNIPNQVVYICNSDHIIPEGLLELFMYVSRETEGKPSLLNKLKGIIALRDSLIGKYKGKLNILANVPSSSPRHKQLAQIYKNGQLSIYNKMIKKLKSIEKQIFVEQREFLISMNDIKKLERGNEQDSLFMEVYDHIKDEFPDPEIFYLVWIWSVITKHDDSEETKWLRVMFTKISFRVDEKVNLQRKDIVTRLSSKINDLMSYSTNTIIENSNSLLLAYQIFDECSYEKGSNKDLILIKPHEITNSK